MVPSDELRNASKEREHRLWRFIWVLVALCAALVVVGALAVARLDRIDTTGHRQLCTAKLQGMFYAEIVNIPSQPGPAHDAAVAKVRRTAKALQHLAQSCP